MMESRLKVLLIYNIIMLDNLVDIFCNAFFYFRNTNISPQNLKCLNITLIHLLNMQGIPYCTLY